LKKNPGVNRIKEIHPNGNSIQSENGKNLIFLLESTFPFTLCLCLVVFCECYIDILFFSCLNISFEAKFSSSSTYGSEIQMQKKKKGNFFLLRKELLHFTFVETETKVNRLQSIFQNQSKFNNIKKKFLIGDEASKNQNLG